MAVSIFDIIGPVTVGPSSSHTAGAVRIGNAARSIAGAPIRNAVITFYGSFAKTYRGHGTDLAIVGGLLGLRPSDPDIRQSFTLAAKQGLAYQFQTDSDPRFHPNTVRIEARTDEKTVSIRASSVGGGAIMLDYMDGYSIGVNCELPTLIVPHEDQPGMIAAISNILAQASCNIASMKLSRAKRGGTAVVVFETDSPVTREAMEQIRRYPGVTGIVSIPKV